MFLSRVPKNFLSSMERASSALQAMNNEGLSNLKPKAGLSARKNSLHLPSTAQMNRTDVTNISAVSSKVSSALSKEYVGAIKAQAKEDAQAGVYGKDGKANELRAEQMKKYISPDRDTAIEQASKLLSGDSIRNTGTSTVKLSDLPYTVSVSKGLDETTAEIFDENGEKIASYDSKTDGWKSVATKAESQFQTASSAIYDEAYRAAQSKSSGSTTGSIPASFNMRG